MQNNYQILSQLFFNIQNNKSKFYQWNSSVELENYIREHLDKLNFENLSNDKDLKLKQIHNKELNINAQSTFDDIVKNWKTLKTQVLSKNNIELITNPFKALKNHFIVQPFGTQQFPDVLIFCNDYVFCLEFKSVSDLGGHKLPVWNSNLPKATAFYIFVQINKNITFFKGNDFLGNSTRIYFNTYFEWIKENDLLNQLKEKLSTYRLLSKSDENIFGLVPRIRKSFKYNLDFSTDKNITIFNQALNKKWEDNLIQFLYHFDD
ncbi:hypothetical protein [Mycoplasma sp. 3686d]|uniref:hypothetical protein n=1 Tax=Mycoplasma sp. 3686d TaxID=2967300 RepID=UPI00211D0D20|nr:hypothetical protein [Mycoplasma sp. 3686d]UUM24566.1 hypothetical protein NPA12_02590 [Mycoplasma sp. 3686d]